ncbi:MAG: hypothetical protein NTV22_10315, partial [bacterium]|nr:hypothetical protein [bacterium]
MDEWGGGKGGGRIGGRIHAGRRGHKDRTGIQYSVFDILYSMWRCSKCGQAARLGRTAQPLLLHRTPNTEHRTLITE